MSSSSTTLSTPSSPATSLAARWIPPVARIGFAARGLVYGLIGGIAIHAALAGGAAKSPKQALASMGQQSGGKALLLAMAAGLVCFVAWQLVRAVLDPEHDDASGKRVFRRAHFALTAVVYGALAFTALRLCVGHGGSSHPQKIWIGRLLAQPFGPWLAMGLGVAVIGFGMHQIYAGVAGRLPLHLRPCRRAVQQTVRTCGRIGITARGLVMLPIGWFVLQAGWYYSASKAADTGQVLSMLGHGWLVAVGAGLAAYGVHEFALALLRRIDPPKLG